MASQDVFKLSKKVKRTKNENKLYELYFQLKDMKDNEEQDELKIQIDDLMKEIDTKILNMQKEAMRKMNLISEAILNNILPQKIII